MPYSTGVIRAVNPVRLAEVSGATKVPGFASSPVPPVVRPDLLTSQLSGCHPQCAHCQGTHGGPIGFANTIASYIPPDYGTLRGLGADGEYGLFKMWSSQGSVPAGPGGGGIPGGTGTSSLGGLGKGAVGTNAASMYSTRNWSYGLRGLGKGAVGTNAASIYATRNWSYGLRGLGQPMTGVLNTAASGQVTLPGIGNIDPGTQGVLQKIVNAINIFHKGSSEANTIVPQQNALLAYLGNITNQIATGQNPSLAQLQNLYTQTWILFVGFIEFVLKPIFTDRRASGQALNTVMPYADGSCGYAVPLGTTASPTQQNCMNWGSGSIGGDGTTGMLGAIGRAITAAGGTVPITQSPVQAANTGIAATTAATTAAAQAAAVAPGSFQSTLVSAGLPSTVAGIPTSTFILIVVGVILLSRMGGK